MAKKTTISFSNGERVHVTFNSEGCVEKAEGFNFILWSSNPDNLNNSLIGMHVYELSECLKKHRAVLGAYEGFEEIVVKKVEKFVRKSSKKTISLFNLFKQIKNTCNL